MMKNFGTFKPEKAATEEFVMSQDKKIVRDTMIRYPIL